MRPLVSAYHPGQRRDWIKVKNIRHAEVIIGGWRPGQGRRTGTIGLLMLGVPDADRLQYAGHVGTGSTDLARRLHPLRHATRLFTTPYPPRTPAARSGSSPGWPARSPLPNDQRDAAAPPQLARAAHRQAPRRPTPAQLKLAHTRSYHAGPGQRHHSSGAAARRRTRRPRRPPAFGEAPAAARRAMPATGPQS